MKKILLFFVAFNCYLNLALGQYDFKGSYQFGKIYDVTYDPQTPDRLYALSLGNHIMYSDDAGQTWDIFYSFPEGTVMDLRYMKEQHALTFYTIHTRGYALYVLDIQTKSISKYFILPPQDYSEEEWIGDYDIQGNNPNVAVVMQFFRIGLTTYQKIHYTNDGGQNWDMIYFNVENDFVSITNVKVHPENPSKIFLSRALREEAPVAGGLLISEDAGQTYELKLANTPVEVLEFHPENSNIMWLGSYIPGYDVNTIGLFKSENGGENWQHYELDWEPYVLNNIVSININPYNPNNILVLEDNEVAITYDGGETWTKYVYPEGYDDTENYSYGTKACFNPYNDSEVYITANYFSFKSNDGGATMERAWNPLFNGSSPVLYTRYPDSTYLFFGVQDGLVGMHQETGDEIAYNIKPLNIMDLDNSSNYFVDPKTPGRIFGSIGGFMGRYLMLSNDFGANHNILYQNFSSTHTAVVPVPNQENKIWAVSSMWGEENELVEIDFSNLEEVQVFIKNLPEFNGDIRNILFDETDNSVLISQGARVYKSTNMGETWEESSTGLEGMNYYHLIIKMERNPLNPNQITLATSNGIYTSIDKGATWTQISTDYAHNIKHSDKTNGHIVAPVHTSNASAARILFSVDGGESWGSIESEDLSYIMVNLFDSTDMDFHEESVDIYFSGIGLGVVKYNLDFRTLSISDPEIISQNKAVLYPNPTKDQFTVQAKGKVQNIEVYALTGQKLISSSKNTVNVAHLNSGVYIVKILMENGETYSEKLIRK